MRIFLIGFMGCGKTTLGKKLAKHLNYNFIDLDSYIEKTTNKTITEIFENKGEKKFRFVEKESLMEVCKKDNLVIERESYLLKNGNRGFIGKIRNRKKPKTTY